MKFPELIIENFLAITEAKINLADRGLVLIQGENNANTSAMSNGAGKSSIADALCWCWFGTTARGVSGDDVVNNVAKKNCRVVSVVVDGATTYTATRHRKHKTGKNTLTIVSNNGLTDTDLTKGTDKLTQLVANQIIGSSLDVFSGSIYAGQEKMPDLPAMTDKSLKMLIEEAAGTTVLEAAYRKAREALQAKTFELEGANARAKTVVDKIAFVKNQRSSIETSIKLWDDNKEARLAAVKTEIGTIVPKLRQLQADLAFMDLPSVEHKIAECDAKIAGVSGEQVELTRLTKAATDIELLFRRAADLEVYATKKLEAATLALSGVAHKVGCPCTECGRPLTDAELADVRAAAETNAKDRIIELSSAKTEAERLEIDFRAAQSARDAYRATMTDISAVSAQRAVLLAEKASIDALTRQQEATTIKARALRDDMTRITAETNPYHPQISRSDVELLNLDTALRTEKVIIERVAAEVALETEVVKLYSPAGVRAHVLDEVTPFLNTQTAKYLTTLSDGNMEATWTTLSTTAKGELREKFTIDVVDTTGGDSFKGLSGGEKRKARIATALALQDLVATRASKPIDLFIGDEIDDALDPAGLERMMIILEEKARERGSVFVISHNELRDHIKQVLTIEKRADKTTKITEMSA